MVSLNSLMSADEKGVQFESPHTGQLTHLTPEHCIEMQVSFVPSIVSSRSVQDDSITTRRRVPF
uniref:Uncharacterized protein n=1 Tax=Parascaris equorum TaxID=6256 RepID=A0A914S4T8_PAREQ